MRQGLVQPAALVSLARVGNLSGVTAVDGTLHIGALTTHREIETSPRVRDSWPVLAETFRSVATIRIRNVATVGGNLAHADPNQDPPVTLLALGASVEVTGRDRQRLVALEDFFTSYYETVLEPGELVTGVSVPVLAPRSGAVFHKFLPRSADDYATVAVASAVTLDAAGERCQEARIALGSVGSTPIRARGAEAALRAQVPTPETLRSAAALVKAEVDPIADIRGSAEYKRDMAEVWTRRTLAQAFDQARASIGER
jgi:carbon-monoxide dehydrogenase medium subunit